MSEDVKPSLVIRVAQKGSKCGVVMGSDITGSSRMCPGIGYVEVGSMRKVILCSSCFERYQKVGFSGLSSPGSS